MGMIGVGVIGVGVIVRVRHDAAFRWILPRTLQKAAITDQTISEQGGRRGEQESSIRTHRGHIEKAGA